MSNALLARLRDEYGAVRDALPDSVIGGERRLEAIEALCAQGLPTTREENWRYANLRVLERARFSPCASPAGMADLPAPLAGFTRFVFLDGVLAMGEPVQHAGLGVRSLRSGAQVARTEPRIL